MEPPLSRPLPFVTTKVVTYSIHIKTIFLSPHPFTGAKRRNLSHEIIVNCEHKESSLYKGESFYQKYLQKALRSHFLSSDIKLE